MDWHQLEGEQQAMRRRNEEHQQNIDQMTTALHLEKASAIEAPRQLESG
jgi:hypothetical protein